MHTCMHAMHSCMHACPSLLTSTESMLKRWPASGSTSPACAESAGDPSAQMTPLHPGPTTRHWCRQSNTCVCVCSMDQIESQQAAATANLKKKQTKRGTPSTLPAARNATHLGPLVPPGRRRPARRLVRGGKVARGARVQHEARPHVVAHGVAVLQHHDGGAPALVQGQGDAGGAGMCFVEIICC